MVAPRVVDDATSVTLIVRTGSRTRLRDGVASPGTNRAPHHRHTPPRLDDQAPIADVDRTHRRRSTMQPSPTTNPKAHSCSQCSKPEAEARGSTHPPPTAKPDAPTTHHPYYLKVLQRAQEPGGVFNAAMIRTTSYEFAID
ncbi:hypothetical protein Dimus_035902 [Dionaea muscipula]